MRLHSKLTQASALLALLTAAGTANAAAPASATASVELTAEAKVLEDDILAVLDLPLVVDAALEAGVAPAEVEIVLKTTADSGMSAGETAMLIAAETKQVEKAGAKPGLGAWVKREVASGSRGQELAAKIAARKAETKPLTDKENAALQKKLDRLKDKRKAERVALKAKRKELLAAGKKPQLVWKEEHGQYVAALEKAKPELIAAKAKLGKRLPKGAHLGASGKADLAPADAAAETNADAKAETPAKPAQAGAGKLTAPGQAKKAEVSTPAAAATVEDVSAKAGKSKNGKEPKDKGKGTSLNLKVTPNK